MLETVLRRSGPDFEWLDATGPTPDELAGLAVGADRAAGLPTQRRLSAGADAAPAAGRRPCRSIGPRTRS